MSMGVNGWIGRGGRMESGIDQGFNFSGLTVLESDCGAV